MKFFYLSLALALGAASAAEACKLSRTMYTRALPNGEWELWREQQEEEITREIYGFANFFHELSVKRAGDFFVYEMECRASDARATLLLEEAVIPLNGEWLPQWEQRYRFRYGQAYRLTHTLGQREFKLVLKFSK